MSAEKILSYVRGLLLQKDELRLLEKSYGMSGGVGIPLSPGKTSNAGGVFAVGQDKTDEKPRDKNPSPGSDRGGGKGASQQASPQRDGRNPRRWPDRKLNECWDCQDLGKPRNHDYRTCEVHKKVYAERRRRMLEREKQAKEASGQKREGSPPKQKQQ